MSDSQPINGAEDVQRLFDAALKHGANHRARAYTRRVIVCAGGGRIEVPPHVSDDLASFARTRLAYRNGHAYLEIDGEPEFSGRHEASPAPPSGEHLEPGAGSGQVLALLRARRRGAA